MNAVRLINLSLKYQRCTLSDYKDIAIRIFKFVTKTQFLSVKSLQYSLYSVQCTVYILQYTIDNSIYIVHYIHQRLETTYPFHVFYLLIEIK